MDAEVLGSISHSYKLSFSSSRESIVISTVSSMWRSLCRGTTPSSSTENAPYLALRTRLIEHSERTWAGVRDGRLKTGFEKHESSVNITATQPDALKGKRRVQHHDFPGGHPSQYYSGPSVLNCGLLMGSGALMLV